MIHNEALFTLSYGVYVLTTNDGKRDNGAIVNTVQMLTETPKRVTIFVNKSNYTEETLRKTGCANVCVLSEQAPFSVIERFGFYSGREKDKFESFPCPTAENGLKYLDKYASAVIGVKVTDAYDYGTHTLFVAEVTDANVISEDPPMTYAHYLANVKPNPKVSVKGEKWVCKICGYVHEGELPSDFICPLCKHPAEDFERLE